MTIEENAATTFSPLSIAIVSTYPPERCGLATFAASLESALRELGHSVAIVPVRSGDGAAMEATEHLELVNGDRQSMHRACAYLARFDAVIVQHEYGIYGGFDGEDVLELVAGIAVPVIVTLHTVPSVPTPRQRAILEKLCANVDRVVVMTASAADRFAEQYASCRTPMSVIPHGATTTPTIVAPVLATSSGTLLTWGLLSEGKGIEHVIRAVAILRDDQPPVTYTVAGITHPKVWARERDHYRDTLITMAEDLGVGSRVNFDASYRDGASLRNLIAGASIVVLPYESHDQVTSGVLIDAVAAGRPVIATAFPHAVELLSSGAGIIVPHGDPGAIARAVRHALGHPGVLSAMRREARRIAPQFAWDTVAAQYARLSVRCARAAFIEAR